MRGPMSSRRTQRRCLKKSPDGFFEVNAGRRLREEIYAAGNERDVNQAVENFLGRPHFIEPFLKKIGAGAN